MPTSKPRKMSRIAITATILAALALALVLLVYSSMRLASVTCEVCIAFRGRNKCRTASAATRQEALRTASDNACDFLASGMSDGIQCSNTPPSSVTCEP
jgi:hypothetical protein